MKKITLYLILLFTFSSIHAQLYQVPVCNGTIGSNLYGPMNSIATAGATSRTAVIYPSSQLAALAGQDINGIYFRRISAAGAMAGAPPLRIYLKDTTATDFGPTTTAAGLDWDAQIADATQVYSDDPTSAVGTTAGWKNFQLGANFLYSGTQNLAVYMEYSNPDPMPTAITWEYEYSAPCVVTTNSNTTKYINNTTGTPGALLNVTNYRRPHIAFDFAVTCPAPTNFASANVLSNSVDLSWVAGGAETEWEYAIALASDPAPTSGTVVTTTSVLGATVLPNSNYTAYVRAICGVGDVSIWKTVNFTTPCASFTPSYTENFATFPPACWTRAGAGTPATGPTGTAVGIWSADGFLNVGTTGAIKANLYFTNRIGWLISPVIDMSAGNYRVKFDYGVTTWNQTTASPMGSDDVVELYASQDNGVTWQLIASIGASSNVSNTNNTFIAELPAYTNANTKFAFYATDGTVDDTPDYDFFIDNFVIEAIPTCTEPTAPVTANLTATSVDVSWTAGGTETEWQYALALNTDPVPTTGTSVMSTSLNGLVLQATTNYIFYVRSVCAAGQFSPWRTVSFTTPCAAFTPAYTENFDTFLPACWSRAGAGTPATGPTGTADGIWFADGFLNSGATGAVKANLYSTNRIGWLISPVIDMSAGNYRVKFDYAVTAWNVTTASPMGSDDVVELYASQDEGVTWQLITSIGASSNVSNTSNTFIAELPAYTNANTKFAFYATDGTVDDTPDYDFFIDNFVIETIPASAPDCPANLTATQDAGCGNFPVTFSWDASAGATSYNLSIGTTAGGTDILDNATQGTAISYVMNAALVNQDYYYTVTATNNVGTSATCTESVFTTATTGCYCESDPISNDGDGVSNVTINGTSYTTADVTYQQLATPIADVSRGIGNTMSITISTDDGFSSYTYNHNVWIDFNDDFVFDASELVVSGESLDVSPTTLNLTFTPDAAVSLGNHTMRIGNADFGQLTPDPCYTGDYGNTIDLIVNVVQAACDPVTYSSATIVPNCTNNEFSVDVVITDLGSATTPEISDGINTYPITAVGTVTVGPFSSGDSVTLSISHQDVSCEVSVDTFTYTCPPANDECAGAIALTAGGTFGEFLTDGTNSGATDSPEADPTDCFGYSGGDVWYTVVVPDSGNITIETGLSSNTDPALDTVVTVYSGACDALVQVNCDDDGGGAGGLSLVSITGQTPGETLYVRVYEYSNNEIGVFGISAYDASLSNGSFDNASFTYYPNPVKNTLNLSYSENISNVEVYNLLGQKMTSNSFDATTAQIDMSSYTSGVYLVKVTSNSTTKTVRVIKE